MLASLYQTLTSLGSPVIRFYLEKRLERGREDAARFKERLGEGSVARPHGEILWCHAASVGEAASLLALISKLRTIKPSAAVLVTTGTVTSARLMETRLPEGCIHQYIPVDRMAYVNRFLDYWKPDLAIWIESELWPNICAAIKAHSIPAVLINGRMSEKSFGHWQWALGWSRDILSTFDLCLAQTDADAKRFEALGAKHVKCVGNLKYAAAPLPYAEDELARLREEIELGGVRPLWLMASTHLGEEEIALAAHSELIKKYPNLLTIIAPRHAIRGKNVAELAQKAGFSFARRSLKEKIKPGTHIYLADTMGELGLFYKLSPIMVMGGSFVPVGGHNPIEAAQQGSAIIFGPYMDNFETIKTEFVTHNAAITVALDGALAPVIDELVGNPLFREQFSRAAESLANDKCGILDDVMRELMPWLERIKQGAA